MARMGHPLPEWAKVGTKIIYAVGYSGDSARIETIKRATDKSVWSASGDYAEGSPNRRQETRWAGCRNGKDTILERWGSDRVAFAYELDSETGRRLQYKSSRQRLLSKIRGLMVEWQKHPNQKVSMELRQSLAKWEVEYSKDFPNPAEPEEKPGLKVSGRWSATPGIDNTGREYV